MKMMVVDKSHLCVCIFREILVEESNVQRVDSPVTVSNIYFFWLMFS